MEEFRRENDDAAPFRAETPWVTIEFRFALKHEIFASLHVFTDTAIVSEFESLARVNWPYFGSKVGEYVCGANQNKRYGEVEDVVPAER